MDKLNVAIAGIGFGASVHLPALNSSKYLNPTSIYYHNKNVHNL